MNLVYLAAVIAVCAAAKLDRTYLPPASATTAGGSAEDIQTPLVRDSFNGQSDFPKGAYDNEFEGVVVEAVAPGTRASSSGETGLGSPRISYGSTHSKVGGAAFKTNQRAQAPVENNFRDDQEESQTLVNFQQGLHTDLNKAIIRPQSALDRVANIIRYENNRGPQNYYYAYETENGITAEESGNLNNGVQAEGGYSYTGDDGKFYKVTYTAGEGGYQPSGDHLPTPPPIPDEILRSLEQNARDAAAGLIDDGSYDAAKYNTGDDYTKNDSSLDDNSRQPISVYKPEFGADITGSHTNENAQTFENINVREKITSPTFNTPKDTTVGSQFNYFPNNKVFRPTATSELGTQEGFSNENRDGINDKKEISNDESSSDEEYSRPIYFGLMKPNQEINNAFGNRPYSTSINSIIRPTVSMNSENSITGLQSHSESFPGYQWNKFSQHSNTVLPTQSSSQFVNGYPNNIELNKESNVQSEAQNNFHSLNNVHSTILPSAELTTPFESTPDINRQEYNSQNVPQRPTQASFSTLTTFDSQSYNGGQSISGTSQNNENFQLNKVTTQQDFQHSIENDKTKISGASQISENSYYYNQPSKPFNTVKATASTFVSGNSHFTNGYKDSISTKYPRPPTIAAVATNAFTESMQNQYSDAPQIPSFGSHLRPFTKYPQPPVISHNVPSPTSPTLQIDNKFSTQHTGITQASVSPFPSTSMTFVGSNSKLQQPVTSFSSTYHQQASLGQGQAFNRGNAGNQVQLQFNKMNSQFLSNQQYDGEIYEYKKPEESLPSPNKSDESDVIKSTNDFSQFGQKIQAAMLNQPLSVSDENESNSEKDESQSIQNTPSLFDSQNLQLDINLQANVDDKQTLMGHSGNTQTFGQESITQKFPSSALQGSQPTVEYNNPFKFSSRIRPCCQGTRTSTTGKDIHNDFSKPLQQTGQDQSEFNSPLFGFQDQQNPQLTSQIQTVNGEEFSGLRQPPNFDEASGYHY